jgi:hypothetical protein
MLIPSTRLRHRRILTEAFNGEIRNIIIVEPREPTKHVIQEKYLNVGLKFGADASSRPRHATFTEA